MKNLLMVVLFASFSFNLYQYSHLKTALNSEELSVVEGFVDSLKPECPVDAGLYTHEHWHHPMTQNVVASVNHPSLAADNRKRTYLPVNETEIICLTYKPSNPQPTGHNSEGIADCFDSMDITER